MLLQELNEGLKKHNLNLVNQDQDNYMICYKDGAILEKNIPKTSADYSSYMIVGSPLYEALR